MFSSNDRSTRLTCGFKVNTSSTEWHKSMTKILKTIKGGGFALDADKGMAYVSGRADPNKLLKLMGSLKGRSAQMAFLQTCGHRHHHPHDPNLFHNSYFNVQSPSCNSYWPSDLGLQPYHHQYSYPGYNDCAYYYGSY
ncbi:unnamed protein product [Thlaspi arvense]|uniref:Uncharacterized protein n=1 Tax=Thlaspi arvense TaxID=13288 RepID=A0AAU9RLF5_THLAR|nr:unnamed protein product [Thlaspi arvense]